MLWYAVRATHSPDIKIQNQKTYFWTAARFCKPPILGLLYTNCNTNQWVQTIVEPGRKLQEVLLKTRKIEELS